ncbi:MAG: acyl-ACP--UDP-N-acetylglucosamine O-acyltransferase [Gammaproteobacteria bacterium]
MNSIHATAVIDKTAQLGDNVTVGPYVVIEADVAIGNDCWLGAHCVIKRYTHLGQRNRIAEHAVIGGEPQDVSFRACESQVWMGDDNWAREGVTIHRATKAGGVTRIGNGNYLMAYAHIAHDCTLGDHVTFANGATLGGHVHVGDRAFLSGYVVVHQFCRIGKYAMVSGLSGVNQDCLPFVISAGIPARACGLNIVGLRRGGFDSDQIRALKHAYSVLLCSGDPLQEALRRLQDSGSCLVQELLAFVQSSHRGFAHHRKMPDRTEVE